MPFNKEDPEIEDLAYDSIRYGRELTPDDHKLRLIRYIIFTRPATMENLVAEYLKRGLDPIVVDIWLDWLIANDIIELKADNTYTLTDDFYKLVRDKHYFLFDHGSVKAVKMPNIPS